MPYGEFNQEDYSSGRLHAVDVTCARGDLEPLRWMEAHCHGEFDTLDDVGGDWQHDQQTDTFWWGWTFGFVLEEDATAVAARYGR